MQGPDPEEVPERTRPGRQGTVLVVWVAHRGVLVPVKSIIYTIMSGNVMGWDAGIESCRSQEDLKGSFGPSVCPGRLHSARRINEERTRENAMHPAVGSKMWYMLGRAQWRRRQREQESWYRPSAAHL